MWSFAILHWLLPPAMSTDWWCETSNVTGCHGQQRQFVLDTSPDVDKFEVFDNFPVLFFDKHLVVDWDNDGDFDIVKISSGSVDLYEQLDRGQFKKVEPSPFKDIPSTLCGPAVVDWNDDGLPDVLLAATNADSGFRGVKYYERHRLGHLVEKFGDENPFQSIRNISGCGYLSVADWDGDGDKDILMSDLKDTLQYFEQIDGTFQPGEVESSLQTLAQFRKPLMVDWNNDSRMDLVLFEQHVRRVPLFADQLGIPVPKDDSTCTVLLLLRGEDGRLTQNEILENKGGSPLPLPGIESVDQCRYQEISLVDVDGDHDLDVIFTSSTAVRGALHVYEHAEDHTLLLHNATQKQGAIQVNEIRLSGVEEGIGGYHPCLVDWDLDGDLDLALLSYNPLATPHLIPRFFEHNADHSVSELHGTPNISCPLNWHHRFSVTDFDGDGLLDIVGDDTDTFVLVCLQTSSGYVARSQGKNPFSGMSNYSLLPSTFLDWDADGDVDLIYRDLHDRLQWIEQLQNGTLSGPLPLLGHEARDYVATDFDGDGDIDLVVAPRGKEGWEYYERREDGSLEELLEDSPFPDSLWKRVLPSLDIAQIDYAGLYSTLGDWNGDGAMDLVVVDAKKVSLLLNKPYWNFLEYTGEDNPFSKIFLSDPLVDAWNMVDVDGDGDLDLVYFPIGRAGLPRTLEGPRYFEQMADGNLEERSGTANPLKEAPTGLRSPVGRNEYPVWGMNHFVADVDGDGDVDVVHGYAKGLDFAEQQNGKFVILKGMANPFHLGIVNPFEHTRYDCWTLVDFDRDGDLDLVKVGPANPSAETFTAAVFFGREVRYYENAAPRNSSRSNFSFHRQSGKANPFWSINLTALPKEISVGAFCPAVVDMDNDGDLDLVLADVARSKTHFLYFQQQGNGRFKLQKKNPFADISIASDAGSFQFQLADFDGDGLVDMVASAGTSLQYFKQRTCVPAASACSRSATCNKTTSACECPTGSHSPECRICSRYHTREDGMCKSCPGFTSVSGTCTHRGTCEDDEDARRRQADMNVTGFTHDSATGTGKCKCSEPFHGEACEQGECPPGQRLERNAKVSQATTKYRDWEACVPCQEGRFKNVFGNQDCDVCSPGLVPHVNRSSCEPCPSGHKPAPNSSSCVPCPAGSVASPFSPDCTPCRAGEAPNAERSQCERCGEGQVANPRSAQCSPCSVGSVPMASRTNCMKCTGQRYALQGDEECRTCTFPAMILGDENWCTSLYFILFLVAFVVLVLFLALVFGRFRLCCFKRRLRAMVEAQNWAQLHMTTTTRLEYGVWRGAAEAVLQAQKDAVYTRSFQLGISLRYAFDELEAVYKEKARQAEWRQDTFGPATRSGFDIRVRNNKDIDDPDAAWNALQICEEPTDPNFHQVASVLAYGPLALGKGQHCPRDGRLDCSIVDALEATSRSGKATWFLSWVWGYKFSTVSRALSRWWAKHQIVSGDDSGKIYIWWCVMVNNQFRMLQENQTVDASKLFDVFGRQLSGIGKMLMCLDKMREGNYTSRIWCIFEVFVACQKSIPTTVILPELELEDSIDTLKELTEQCRVDAEQAQASVAEDAIAIKKKIMDDHGSFEFVNQTVEKELYFEVIKFMEGSEESSETSERTSPQAAKAAKLSSTATATNPSAGVSEMSTDYMSVHKHRQQCSLQ